MWWVQVYVVVVVGFGQFFIEVVQQYLMVVGCGFVVGQQCVEFVCFYLFDFFWCVVLGEYLVYVYYIVQVVDYLCGVWQFVVFGVVCFLVVVFYVFGQVEVSYEVYIWFVDIYFEGDGCVYDDVFFVQKVFLYVVVFG